MVAVLVGVAGACGGAGTTATDSSTPSAPAKSRLLGKSVLPDAQATDFTLRDQAGTAVTLSSQRGRVVVLAFLYTHCRDVCPLVAERLQAALEALGPAARRVRVLAVSVDPENDTIAAVRTFIRVHRLGSQFHYLVGSRAELAPIWQSYNVLAIRRNDQVVDHSAPTLLIDRRGRPRVYFAATFSTGAVLNDLRLLLAA